MVLARDVRVMPLPPAWPVYVSQAEACGLRALEGTRACRPKRSSTARRSGPRAATSASIPGVRRRRTPSRGNFDFAAWEPVPVGSRPGRRERVGRARSGRQRLGVDVDRVRAVPRLRADGVVSGVLGRLLRRPALRDEGRLARDGAASCCAAASATGSGRTIRTSTRGSGPRREFMDRRGAGPSAWRRQLRSRLRETHDHQPPTRLLAEFAADVRRDLALAPKQLQSKYLYDALGSSLFEAICRLPWYRITRAESALARRRTRAEVVTALGDRTRPRTIVELGCGSGEKLVILAEALQAAGGSARVHLIDISSQALEQTEQRARRACSTFRSSAISRPTRSGLRRAAAARTSDGPDARPAARIEHRQLRRARRRWTSCAASALALQPGDLLLLGADLVKPEHELQLAYADPLGVTAAFNKNLLVRINRELGGHFDLDAFDHLAVWNAARAADRDASRQPCRADGDDRRAPHMTVHVRAAASASGRRARTSTSRTRSSAWRSRPGSRCAISGSTTQARFALSLLTASHSTRSPTGSAAARCKPLAQRADTIAA